MKAVSEETLAKLKKTAPDVYFVGETKVACNGDGGALGHPKVYYTIGDEGFVECGYCDRAFVYEPARAGQKLEEEG